MDGTNPKISFIPKGSLVREESFLERPRPRSMMGLLAVFIFIASVGTYAGFYFYNDSFEKDIVLMRDKIDSTRNTFRNAPQVEEAQSFSSRANVARSLLSNHTVVSPVLTFLAANTVESIVYDKFSFSQSAGGSKIDLTGEAPNYAALAYQGDILRNKKELLNFSISNINLTPFGTVVFSLELTFTPDYLSYAKNLSMTNGGALNVPKEASIASSTIPMTTSGVGAGQPTAGTTSSPTSSISTSTSQIVPVISGEEPAKTTPVIVPSPTKATPSKLMSLWLKFKFW